MSSVKQAKASARDVARIAGVSQPSVSRAFANAPGVSQETRDRIFQIAKDIGYWPNALASSLITRSSGMIGVVVSNLTNPFLSDVLDRILRRMRVEGLQPLIFSPKNEADHSATAFDLGRYGVDGLLVISPHLDRDTAETFSRLGPTVLLFNPKVPGLKSSSVVSVDNVAAGRMVAEHLISLGHRSFGYVHGIEDARTDRERYQGYQQGLAAAGRAIGHEVVGVYDYRLAADAALKMLRARTRPTAVFCANDMMAMGVVDAARYKLGLRVPEDVSIVGFDDVGSAAWDSYALTTIRQPVDAILDEGFSILLQNLRGEAVKPRSIALGASLIVRSTTGPAPSTKSKASHP